MTLFFDLHKLMLIEDTAFVTPKIFRNNFNCRYNPKMNYALCLLTLKSLKKNGDPHYLVLHATPITKFYLLTFISTTVFCLLPFKWSH